MLLRTLFVVLLASPSAQAFQASTFTSVGAKQATVLKSHLEDQEDAGRRAFVGAGLTAAVSLMLPQMPAYADEGVDYKAVAKDIMGLVEKNPDWGPSEFRRNRLIANIYWFYRYDCP